jgi:hypothetical protein
MDPITTTILAAGVPVLAEMVKSIGGAIGRRFAGLSVDDQIKLQQADVARLQALAQLDAPTGTPSAWVVDLRASFRYIAAGGLVAVGCAAMLYGVAQNDADIIDIGAQVAGFPFAFVFGERMVLSLKSRAR